MRRLCRKEICDDIGGLSWPSAKMMMGIKHPDPTPAPGDPLFFLYVDLTSETKAEMRAKEAILRGVLKDLTKEGERFEEPLDVLDLVKVNPGLSSFANFPTDLEFLTSHGGGGMSWIGTYGPLSKMDEGIQTGIDIMVRHGFPPLIVSRPMRGGHFVVLRLITTFDKRKPEEIARVKTLNAELLEAVTKLGYVMYKTPIWAWNKLAPKMDPGMLAMIGKVKKLMDPNGIFNPGKMNL
jgi:FAD/FMN-containing dehydrogenase